jgi:hypothetical protein
MGFLTFAEDMAALVSVNGTADVRLGTNTKRLFSRRGRLVIGRESPRFYCLPPCLSWEVSWCLAVERGRVVGIIHVISVMCVGSWPIGL